MPAGSVTLPLTWLLAALSVAASPLAHADFQEDYALGLKSIDDGRYQDARMYLRRALDEQPGPVARVILNGNIEQPYLPYHFLGIVAFKLGECDAAKAQWANPTNQRMLGRLNAIRRLEQRMSASCKPRPAAVAKQPAPASKPVSAPVLEPAPPPPSQTPAAEPPARKPPAEKPQAVRPSAAKSQPATRERAAEPPRAKPPAAPPAEAAPPARLVRAVDSYLAGRYADAARVSPEALPAGRARFHAYLIRAAARYTLAELDGDERLLAKARSDVLAAKSIDSAAAPDPVAFSPKFRAFYAAAR